MEIEYPHECDSKSAHLDTSCSSSSFNSTCPWRAEIRVVAFSSCSPVMITGTLRNHSSLPDTEGQLQMFFLAFSNSKKPVQASFFSLLLLLTMPGWQDSASNLWLCQMSPHYSSVYLCSSSFCLLWLFHKTVEQWLKAVCLRVTTEHYMSSNITRLVVYGWKGGGDLVIIHSHKEVWQED